MKDLPESITPKWLMSNAVLPGDVTLAEARASFEGSAAAERLASAASRMGKKIRIRYVLDTEPETEAPDDMTLDQFRELCFQGKAWIAIDDQGGGMRTAPERPKELV